MIKDKLLHDRLGIPQQTLQNWKNSDTYTSMLYKYLISMDEEKFKKDTQLVGELYNYVLMTPTEFCELIKKDWSKFKQFSGYASPLSGSVGDIAIGDEETLTFAVTFNPKNKELLLVRFVYAMVKKKETFLKEIEKFSKLLNQLDEEVSSCKFIYITSSLNAPKYFDEIQKDVSILNYKELYKVISDKHLLII